MKKLMIYIGITVLINIIFRVISRLSPDFSEWYATHIYPLFVAVFGGFWGLFPFSVIEILLYILIIAVLAGIVYLVRKLIKHKTERKKTLLNALVALTCAVSTLLVIFLFGCEINYQRKPFSAHSGLVLSEYSTQELRDVIDEVIGELERLSPLINTDEQGGMVLDKARLNPVSRAAMRKLGEQYPALATYYPNAKGVAFSREILSSALIAGVYSPFTIEANYNRDMPDVEIPFVVCHELSHLSGFMREDEANFIAFLACRESGDIEFLYSGYYKALVYLINAYYGEVELEEYREMYATIPEQVRVQMTLVGDYWRPFRDTPVAQAASAVNDAHLKIQGQEDGVKSYGRMVDLLIAD